MIRAMIRSRPDHHLVSRDIHLGQLLREPVYLDSIRGPIMLVGEGANLKKPTQELRLVEVSVRARELDFHEVQHAFTA
jgi:hypothetical protein